MSGRKSLGVLLDVSFYDHPKVIEAGEKADRLYTQALCLAKRTLSDGFVSDAQIKRFGLSGVAARARSLEAAGLFHRDDERAGWWIHDFLDHNRSRAEQEAIVAKRRAAGSKGGRPQKPDGKQVANQPAEQAGNPVEKSREEKSREETPTTTRGSTQDRLSTGPGGRGDRTPPTATHVVQRALALLGYESPDDPTLREVRTVGRALGRGWTSAELIDLASEAAANPDVRDHRQYVFGGWEKRANRDPDPTDGATPIEPIRPVTLSRPHPADCPGGCDDNGLVDTGEGLAQCTGNPIAALAATTAEIR